MRDRIRTAILVVSFGTSYMENGEITIGGIERAVAAAFPACEVRRAFTSQVIINKLRERDGLLIDNVTEALQRAAADGIRQLIVQPTHMMDGYEYMHMVQVVKEYEEQFEQLALGQPLLTGDADFEAVIRVLMEEAALYDDGETAVCFMGHGTGAASNAVYARLQEEITAAGCGCAYIGTVEADPSLEKLMALVKAHGPYRRVVLEPLMVVAGDHAHHDMASDEADSWKSRFETAGYRVTCVVRGMGELPAIQQIYVAHARAAADFFA